MKDEALENTVVTLHSKGRSIRCISKDLYISRGRVRRILQANTTCRDIPTEGVGVKTPGKSKLDSYKEFISDFLSKYSNATGQRVYEHIKSKGYNGGITIVRDYLLSIRGRSTHDPVHMVETSPGQRSAHDWSDYNIAFTGENKKEKTKVTFFSYILSYSRRQYIEVVEDKTRKTLFRALINAFIHMDGIPLEIKSDNQKACVDRWENARPVFNNEYLSFASHYRFRPLTIRPGRPQENLKIERPFYYLETSFLNAREFKDIDDLKDQLKYWLANINDVRIHGTTKKRPIDMHADEHAYLQRIPLQHFDTSCLVHLLVNNESCVYWKGYQYMVDSNYMYDLCPVRITTATLTVYSSKGEHLITHRLAEKGRSERYVGKKLTKKKTHELSIGDIEQRLKDFGPYMEKYIHELKKHRPQLWRGDLRKLLALKINYHPHDIHMAIGRALDYKVFEQASIERFLDNNAKLLHEVKISLNNPKDTGNE